MHNSLYQDKCTAVICSEVTLKPEVALKTQVKLQKPWHTACITALSWQSEDIPASPIIDHLIVFYQRDSKLQDMQTLLEIAKYFMYNLGFCKNLIRRCTDSKLLD